MRALLRRIVSWLMFGRTRTVRASALQLAQRRELRRQRLGGWAELPPHNRPTIQHARPRPPMRRPGE